MEQKQEPAAMIKTHPMEPFKEGTLGFRWCEGLMEKYAAQQSATHLTTIEAQAKTIEVLVAALNGLFTVAALLKFEPDEGQPHPLKDGIYDRAMGKARSALAWLAQTEAK